MFHEPATRLHGETARAWLALHDLQVPPVALVPAPVRQPLAAVGRIRPDLLETRHEEGEPAQEPSGPLGI